MNRTWTYRAGEITDKDKIAIRALANLSPASCQVLLTGETLIFRIGELELHTLLNVNDMVDEPLFVLPSSSTYGSATVRMTRFAAFEVWPSLGTELLKDLVANECGYLGVRQFIPETFDFYESLFTVENLFDTYKTVEDNLYLNALTIFRKPLYGDLHASTFFSSAPSLTTARATMTESMLADRDKVWDKSKQRLTNAELEFLVDIR